MAANIQTVFICPRCDEGITTIDNATHCPNCHLPLGKQEYEPYSLPYTLSEQHEKHRDTVLHVKTIINMPIGKANSILNDALSIIELLSGKNNHPSDIRTLVGMAMKIGDIAKTYDAYLVAGGKHTPAFFVTTPSTAGDTNELIQTTTSGGEPSTST